MNLSGLLTGVDLVDSERLARMVEQDDTFLMMAFTEAERGYCDSKAECLAARWAAKEAVMKALGRGIGNISPLDIEVQHEGQGEPILVLTGAAQARAEELGVVGMNVTLSHERGIAVGFVVMMKGMQSE